MTPHAGTVRRGRRGSDPEILIVPGYRGSGPAHWQTWMQQQRPTARRVAGIDWEQPVLARWAAAVRDDIDAACNEFIWLVAHSFGCLASVVAAADRGSRVGGLLLVAPANPQRFGPLGLLESGARHPTLCEVLPTTPLPVASVLVASRNDPWMEFDLAARWARCWGSDLVDLGEVGHINAESGHGPWPLGLDMLDSLLRSHRSRPSAQGLENTPTATACAKGHALARVRHQARHWLPDSGGLDSAPPLR